MTDPAPTKADTAASSEGGAKKLGPDFRKLWAAAISTVGDGVFLTAMPLLAAQLTRDPLPVWMLPAAC